MQNAAAIRKIFEIFSSKCRESHFPGKKCCNRRDVGYFLETLSKPAKFGVNIFLLTDSKTMYTSNMSVYWGKQPDGPFEPVRPIDIVTRLTEHIYSSGRN